MKAIEKLLDDEESRRLLLAARSVPGGLDRTPRFEAAATTPRTPRTQAATRTPLVGAAAPNTDGLGRRPAAGSSQANHAASKPGVSATVNYGLAGDPASSSQPSIMGTARGSSARPPGTDQAALNLGAGLAAAMGRSGTSLGARSHSQKGVARAAHRAEGTNAQPPRSKVADLEGRITEGLESLLREVQLSLQRTRQEHAAENDRLFATAQRRRVDAELEYWTMPIGTSLAGGASVRTLTLMEIQAIEEQLEAPAVRVPGPSRLPGMVEALLEKCQRQHRVACGMDKLLQHTSGTMHHTSQNTVEGRTLAVAESLGQLLIEADRDCQALALSLASGAGVGHGMDGTVAGPQAQELRWVHRLKAAALANDSDPPPPPLMESLIDQLQAENETLGQAIAELRRRKQATQTWGSYDD
mmetsp:Transcript_85717/g.239607  ORF Transcript_85717/g.239607 Transcript_85717/m.239607 type:complete len:414 (-) Transcript_85717:90-1331(-)